MEKLRFYDFMRAGHIKRWHIVNTVREQTIAEHQYLVTIIAMELYMKMADNPVDDRSTAEFAALMVAAMFHDAPEVRYGDFPSPAKRHIREIVGKIGDGKDVFEVMDQALMPKLPYIGTEPSPLVTDFVHMADAIESAHWISENKAGVHSDVVAKGNARRMAELTVELTQKTGWDWFGPVNEVLIELGMPYLSRSMLVTPP